MSTMRLHLLVLIALVSSACVEHKCPKGYREEGDTCYRINDAGLAEGGTDLLDAEVSPVETDTDGAASPSQADASPLQDADDPGELDASTDDDSSAPDGGPAGPCQGTSGKPVCVGAVMHHCSADGDSEHTEACASEQQCQTGAPFGNCAPCLKGKFQCKEARLERCSDDGQRWELEATCDSAALCNETAGACTDKACTANTRICDGDVLTGCNANLTALTPIKTCGPSLCDQAQGECDVCSANAKRCDQDVVISCDANGRKETRLPCSDATPKCAGSGNCVECVRNTDCTGDHKLCTGNRCVVQPYCGDGNVTTGEECDPKAAGESDWSCNAQCKKTTAYTWCAGKDRAPNAGCSTGETCFGGQCAARCNLVGDCPPAATGEMTCAASWKVCIATGCRATSDCPSGMICSALPENSGLSSASGGGTCAPCDAQHPCPTGSRCALAAPDDKYMKCLTQ